MGIENVRQRLSQTEVAEVAGVCNGSASALLAKSAQGLQGSCRGRDATSAPISPTGASTCEATAGVAEVSCSFTHTPAHVRAHTRAREQQVDAGPVQAPQPLHVPGRVTLLKHCRCVDCRNWIACDLRCRAGIGGVKVEWGTGKRICEPLPDTWHYCAGYHGPQISPDVWVWPHCDGVEMVSVGPSGEPAAGYRGGNGSAACLFRSTARTQGDEGSAAGLLAGRPLTPQEPQVVVEEHRRGKLAGRCKGAGVALKLFTVLLLQAAQALPTGQHASACVPLEFTRHHAVERHFQPSTGLCHAVCLPEVVVVEARPQEQVQRFAGDPPRLPGVGELPPDSLGVKVQPTREVPSACVRHSPEVHLGQVPPNCVRRLFRLATDSAGADGIDSHELLNDCQESSLRDRFPHRQYLPEQAQHKRSTLKIKPLQARKEA